MLHHIKQITINTKLGYVAEFCPYCRDIRRFQVNWLGKKATFLGFEISSAKYVCHILNCQTCDGSDYKQDPIYTTYQLDKTELDTLIGETNPEIVKRQADRLKMEKNLSSLEHAPELRRALLKEPLRYVYAELSHRASEIHFDTPTTYTLIIVSLALIVLITQARYTLPPESSYYLLGSIVAGGFGIPLLIYIVHTEPARYARPRLIRLLARALKPLNPTQLELRAAIQELRINGFSLLKHIDPTELHAEIERK